MRRVFCFSPKCRYPPEISTRTLQVGAGPAAGRLPSQMEGLHKSGSELGSLS